MKRGLKLDTASSSLSYTTRWSTIQESFNRAIETLSRSFAAALRLHGDCSRMSAAMLAAGNIGRI
jgi:hypothetical protein